MRWRGREQSENVEDRRGMSPRAALGGGGIGALLIALVAMFLGADGQTLARLLGRVQVVQQPQQGAPPANDPAREFISVTLRDTEVVWTDLFRQHGLGQYAQPKLIIFEGRVNSRCGSASSAVGPFYCPADQQVYIDPSFFNQLAQRHSAPGDFAQAYVIAHEVAHHVQFLLGFSDQVNQIRARGNEIETNRASVRLELQADFLAGVWAHHAHRTFGSLESGDILEAIRAANQIGDDTLQREAGQRVMPDRFTHGTSEQRQRWFSEGIQSGDMTQMELLFRLPYDQL